MSKIISVPQLIRAVTDKLRASDDAEKKTAAIPSEDLVYVQFMPSKPTSKVAARFSARFKVIRKVQTRCLRKEHEDAHFVMGLMKYCKEDLVAIMHLAKQLKMPSTTVAAVGQDDKANIPYGLPGTPISATARGHAGGGRHGVLAPEGAHPVAADHDIHKGGSLTTSVTLSMKPPKDASDSWYGPSTIFVNVRDKVFAYSDVFLHCGNLLKVLRLEVRD